MFFKILRFQKYYKNRGKFCLNSIVYILFSISIYLYNLSLKGCFLSFRQCAYYDKLPEYFHLGFLLILSCLVFGLAISIQFISRLSITNYLIFFISYLIIFYFNQGTDFAHHGTYNSITFILFFPLFSILFYLIYIISYFRKNGCDGFNDNKKTFMKYLHRKLKKFNHFAYPRTESWNPQTSYKFLAGLIEKNIFPVNKNNLETSEVFVSFKDNKGKIEINLKKNESLINEKRKLAEKFPVKFENIYLIYLDALSRNNFIRRLKKSTKIIEQIIYFNRKREKEFEQYNAFQFFKYHNFNGHTQGNIYPLFYGNQPQSKRGISIVKFLNEKGFITASAHNSCNRDIFDWYAIGKNIQFSNYDHENVAMFCDTNYEDKRNKWSIRKGKSSILRRCFYGRDSFDYNFDYILQFLEAYKNERKYFRITFGDGHEATTEVIKYIDSSLSNFILKLLKDYFTDKTAIIILSDHGAQMPGPYDILFYEEKITEKYLGLLLLILPNNNNYNSSNIIYNQQQMITTYDIHDTLLDMINVNKYDYKNLDSNRGQSLFLKINGKERNCQKYKGEITKEYCFCHRYN